MAVAFQPGQELVRGDLDIYIKDRASAPFDPAEITYAIYWVDPGPPEAEVLIGAVGRIPTNPAVGEYYAALIVPIGATIGTYRIRWTIREAVGTPLMQVVQEWAVVLATTAVASPYTVQEQEMIDTLRVMLRDNDPDRNYHFRPPEHEEDIGDYNRIFGYVWTDAELYQYLLRSIDWWDMFPPRTYVSTVAALVGQNPGWRTAIYYGAMMFALMALAINWVHEEFDYSIGGVSLSIEKSSKYESLKSNAEGQFDKAVEAKQRTVKFIRGLQQPRYGIGIRSAFGPRVGRGVLSPRNFIVGLFSCGMAAKMAAEVLPYADYLLSMWA